MKNRLIDANKVEIGFDELCQSPYFKNDVNAKHGAETLMDLCVRSDSHNPNTIDPETLPIVQELRKELERVTAERDSLIWDMKVTGSGCYSCKHFDAPNGKCKANEPCGVNNNWEWRGIQEVKDDE